MRASPGKFKGLLKRAVQLEMGNVWTQCLRWKTVYPTAAGAEGDFGGGHETSSGGYFQKDSGSCTQGL